MVLDRVKGDERYDILSSILDRYWSWKLFNCLEILELVFLNASLKNTS
jgi:hypothetical protein